MIVVIPARGKSKRIPRKNIRNFFGVPILSHTIFELQKTKLFSKIIVSTEDEEIAKIAVNAGARVLMREVALADDFTSTVDVIASVLSQLESSINLEKEVVCCVYPVTPELSKEYILQALKILENGELDYVFTAKRYQSSPARSFERQLDGKPKMYFSENLNSRTQDLPEFFHDAALFYLGRAKAWAERKPILNGNSEFIEIGKYEAIDVDDEQDWQMMVDLYQIKKNSNS
jgi:pseudaminic acid cytidylyltransferase